VKPIPPIRAFSLIEVTLALGIISFALVAVMGLLPTGLSTQRHAVNQSFGVQGLNDVVQALQGIHVSTNGATNFLAPLENLSVAAGTTTLTLYEDGSLTNTSSPPRAKVFIDQKAPIGNSLPVFVSVAWPETATRNGANWSNASGSASAFLYLTP
jgi:type II secretory pathway pseudopilin PulG